MIHIDGDWYIDIDDYTYNLQQYAGTTVDKDGKERTVWKNISYHSSLANALYHYEIRMIRESLKPDMELDEAIKHIDNQFNELERKLTKITHGA